jgi:urease accessory protein UreH
MNSHDFPESQFSRAEIEGLLARARAEQTKAMREMLSELPALIKRLVARLRPNRQHLPQTRACA